MNTLTTTLMRLDRLPMFIKAGWLVWLVSGAILVHWRRRVRSDGGVVIESLRRPSFRAKPIVLRLESAPIPVATIAQKTETGRKTSKRRRRARGHNAPIPVVSQAILGG